MVEVKIRVNGGSGGADMLSKLVMEMHVMQNLETSREGEAFALGVREVGQVLQASQLLFQVMNELPVYVVKAILVVESFCGLGAYSSHI